MSSYHIDVNLISEALICPKCARYFDDPRVLECGHSLCYPCILDLIKPTSNTTPTSTFPNINKQQHLKCPKCMHTSKISKKSNLGGGGVINHPLLQQHTNIFPQNEFIKYMLSLNKLNTAPPQPLSPRDKLTNTLSEVEKRSEQLEKRSKNSRALIKSHCDSIRAQINASTRSQIEKLEHFRQQFFDRLGHFESECMANIEENQLGEVAFHFLSTVEISIKEVREFLKTGSNDHVALKEHSNFTENCLKILNKKIVDAEICSFKYRKPYFQPSAPKLNEFILGKLFFGNIGINTDNLRTLSLRHINPTKDGSQISIYRVPNTKYFIKFNLRCQLGSALVVFDNNGVLLDPQSDLPHLDLNSFLLKIVFHKDHLFMLCQNYSSKEYVIYSSRFVDLRFTNMASFKISAVSGEEDEEIYSIAVNSSRLFCFMRTKIVHFEFDLSAEVTVASTLKFNLNQQLSIRQPNKGADILVDEMYVYVRCEGGGGGELVVYAIEGEGEVVGMMELGEGQSFGVQHDHLIVVLDGGGDDDGKRIELRGFNLNMECLTSQRVIVSGRGGDSGGEIVFLPNRNLILLNSGDENGLFFDTENFILYFNKMKRAYIDM